MNIQQFWESILAQDEQKIRTYFHPKAYVNWHCTNEHFSVEEFIEANCEYPEEWGGEVGVRTHTLSFHVTSFIGLQEDKIISMDEYWADDGDAPQWRKDKKIGRPIMERRQDGI